MNMNGYGSQGMQGGFYQGYGNSPMSYGKLSELFQK